ncbi:MAG: putative DNA binding domain-containing protein, partial [Fibromonadales bacterium]|nr:putative DNA binding domain-containing protein [Fibromonadales bacterium]
MTQQALIELVRRIQREKCEHQNIEVKSAFGGTPTKLYDSLSSFSNQDGGGIIIFGISEEDDFAIVGVHNAQKLQDQVTEQCKQMAPEIRPVFTACEIDGKMIVSLEIPEINVHDKPCFYKGAGRLKGSYVRIGGQDIQMTEYEVYSYESFKQQIYDDLKTVERANIADLESIALGNFIMKLQTVKPKLASLKKNEILKLQGIAIDSKPTVTGIMIFGKYPQGFFPQLAIT